MWPSGRNWGFRTVNCNLIFSYNMCEIQLASSCACLLCEEEFAIKLFDLEGSTSAVKLKIKCFFPQGGNVGTYFTPQWLCRAHFDAFCPTFPKQQTTGHFKHLTAATQWNSCHQPEPFLLDSTIFRLDESRNAALSLVMWLSLIWNSKEPWLTGEYSRNIN